MNSTQICTIDEELNQFWKNHNRTMAAAYKYFCGRPQGIRTWKQQRVNWNIFLHKFCSSPSKIIRLRGTCSNDAHFWSILNAPYRLSTDLIENKGVNREDRLLAVSKGKKREVKNVLSFIAANPNVDASQNPYPLQPPTKILQITFPPVAPVQPPQWFENEDQVVNYFFNHQERSSELIEEEQSEENSLLDEKLIMEFINSSNNSF
jgi:hypothetical protein